MSTSSLTDRVRQFIYAELEKLAGQAGPPLEALLIREGLFCGRRFALGEHQAVWFIEEDEVKFYGSEGQLLAVHTPSQLAADSPAEPLTRAA